MRYQYCELSKALATCTSTYFPPAKCEWVPTVTVNSTSADKSWGHGLWKREKTRKPPEKVEISEKSKKKKYSPLFLKSDLCTQAVISISSHSVAKTTPQEARLHSGVWWVGCTGWIRSGVLTGIDPVVFTEVLRQHLRNLRKRFGTLVVASQRWTGSGPVLVWNALGYANWCGHPR